VNSGPERPTQPPLTHSERQWIVFGVLLPVFLGSLDQTILASALPTMGREIGHVRDLPWLITTYLLASTAVTPLYGKIADIRGRRFALRIAISFYLAGSLVCALAPDFAVLIAGRILQGVGGGGLTSLGMVVLGDIVSPKERGKYYAYFSVIYTTAGASGPALGGAIAEHVHWSAIFWLNVPLGLLALGLATVLLRRLPRHERPHRLDLLGAGLIVIAAVSFMLMLNVGGVRAPWFSWPVLALAAFAVVGGIAFVLRLKTAPEPLIPLTMLANPIARCAIASNGFGWGAIVALNIYLPLYLQTVMGLSATHAGLSLMVLMGAVNISAGTVGQILGRVRHYKMLPMLLLTLAICAVLTLSWRAADLSPLQFEILIALIGIGFGPVAPLSTVSMQNATPAHQFGIAIGTQTFSRNLIGTILVALFGAVLSAHGTASAAAFQIVFALAAASMGIALVSIMLMEERPLQAGIGSE
jgi:EmrB/QacA subfamily drug resistance transporter